MTKDKFLSVLLAAALALPLASHAEQGGPPMGRPGMPFLHGLNLSDAQEEKVFQLMHGQAPYLREQQRAHEKAMRSLHEMRKAEAFDEAAAARLAQDAAQAQANITLAHMRTQHKVLALLTPEQRKQLEERKPRRHRGEGREH